MENTNSWLAALELNWADEADFKFYSIVSNDEKADIEKALARHANDYVNVYFGTNEDSEYTGDEIASAITWTQIPSHEVKNFIEEAIDLDDKLFDIVDDFSCSDDECDECDECDEEEHDDDESDPFDGDNDEEEYRYDEYD